MAKIEGLDKVLKMLEARKRMVEKKVSVIVGFTAAYALWVHERVEEKWRGLPRPPSESGRDRGNYWDPAGRGQSKFLEAPAREMQDELVALVINLVRQGNPLSMALVVAGMRLQREAQLRVPVDTGNLKASAFTRLEE